VSSLRNGIKAITENKEKDLIIIFNGKGNGITDNEFAPKLIRKTKPGNMICGYARLPYMSYIEPVLSVTAPVFDENTHSCQIEVQDLEQIASEEVSIKVECFKDRK